MSLVKLVKTMKFNKYYVFEFWYGQIILYVVQPVDQFVMVNKTNWPL